MAPEASTPVPFNRATVSPRENEYVSNSLASGHVAGDGPFSRAVAQWFATYFGHDRTMLTPSCTAALEMAALLAQVGAGDEVVVPSFTFVTSANAFAKFGARIRFADVASSSMNASVETIAPLINERTKVVVVVHYGGNAVELCELRKICDARGIVLVEDCAHSLFSKGDSGPVGLTGDVSTFSFHETKNISCGEGGLLVVNNPLLLDRAFTIRDKGTNRRAFFEGLVDKYSWVDVGSSYLLADPLAAVLLAQLEDCEEIQARRRSAWWTYREGLGDWAEASGVVLPDAPQEPSGLPYHLFHIILPERMARQAVLEDLRTQGVHAVFHYVPLHDAAFPTSRAWCDACPKTTDLAHRLVRLPLFSDITESEATRVVDAVRQLAF